MTDGTTDFNPEHIEQFTMNMRFLAQDTSTGKEDEDKFELTIKSSKQSRSDLCLTAFDDLTLVDPMQGMREYMILDDEVENWQPFYIESRLDGLENLGDCRHQLTMVVEYQKLSETWAEIWNEKKPEHNGENIYVDISDTYSVLMVNLD
jgi:hypothetical protein